MPPRVRVILELRNIFETAKWMLTFDELWDEWAQTPGGIIYSLDAIDQERLLAVKFTRLVQALVKRDVRLIFLDFPRIVEDAEYLYYKLKDFIPASVDLRTAAETHTRVANKEGARVSKERAAVHDFQAPAAKSAPMEGRASPPLDERREFARSELELIALRREIARQKAMLGDVSNSALAISQAQSRLGELTELLRVSQEQVSEANKRLQEAQSQVAELKAQLQDGQSDKSKLSLRNVWNRTRSPNAVRSRPGGKPPVT